MFTALPYWETALAAKSSGSSIVLLQRLLQRLHLFASDPETGLTLYITTTCNLGSLLVSWNFLDILGDRWEPTRELCGHDVFHLEPQSEVTCSASMSCFPA